MDALDARVGQIDLQIDVRVNRMTNARFGQSDRHFHTFHADPVE